MSAQSVDCEDELLAVAGEVEIANFPEASRAVIDGPYGLTLVEGSVTTAMTATAFRKFTTIQISHDHRRMCYGWWRSGVEEF